MQMKMVWKDGSNFQFTLLSYIYIIWVRDIISKEKKFNYTYAYTNVKFVK